jgi:Polyphosphate kinase 2 (PPK2)
VSNRNRSQVYVQRYIAHFPAAGEIILFDRSWYNMAGVDRVMGFCTEEEYVFSRSEGAGNATCRKKFARPHGAQSETKNQRMRFTMPAPKLDQIPALLDALVTTPSITEAARRPRENATVGRQE